MKLRAAKPTAVILAIATICLIWLGSTGCITGYSGSKSFKMTEGSDNFWRIEGTSLAENWIELRYLMGRQKSGGVRVWDESSDEHGRWHMLVDLIIYE